jgi:hypothetical protein
VPRGRGQDVGHCNPLDPADRRQPGRAKTRTIGVDHRGRARSGKRHIGTLESSVLSTRVVRLALVDAGGHGGALGRRLPAPVGDDQLGSAVLILETQLRGQRHRAGVGDREPAVEAEPLAIPALRNRRAEDVAAATEQFRDIGGLEQEPVLVGRPSRREGLVAHECTVDPELVHAVCRRGEHGSAHRPIDLDDPPHPDGPPGVVLRFGRGDERCGPVRRLKRSRANGDSLRPGRPLPADPQDRHPEHGVFVGIERVERPRLVLRLGCGPFRQLHLRAPLQLDADALLTPPRRAVDLPGDRGRTSGEEGGAAPALESDADAGVGHCSSGPDRR